MSAENLQMLYYSILSNIVLRSEPGNTENQRLETENGLVEDGDSKMKSIIFRFYADFCGCNISCAKRHFLS